MGTFAIQLAKHLGATVATTASAASVDLVRSLGADVVVSDKQEAFANVLRDHDMALHRLDKATLEKALRVLNPGGQVISISGLPNAAFGRSLGTSWVLRTTISVPSYGVTAKVRRRSLRQPVLFIRAHGQQLTEIAALVAAGAVRPIPDRVFPFASTNEAVAYVRHAWCAKQLTSRPTTSIRSRH